MERTQWLRYSLGRAGQYVLVLAMAVSLNFFVPRLAPGDPLRALVGADAALLPPAEKRAVIARAGLDRPLPVQFADYARDLFGGDFGYSYRAGRPVGEAIAERLPLTLLLVGPAALASALAGVLVGAWAAWRRGNRNEAGVLAVAVGLDAIPAFLLGTLLLLALAVKVPLFPVSSALPVGPEDVGGLAQVWNSLRHLALPFLTLTLSGLGSYALLARSSMLRSLNEDYILMARAKGCTLRSVVYRHALRNSLLPIFTLFSLNLGFLLGGSVVVETVFTYPGLGRLSYDAVVSRDLPMLQGTFLVFTVSVVVVNLLTDLTYPLLDPRIRRDRGW